MNPGWLRYSGVTAVVVLWTTLGLGSRRARFDLLGERPLSYLAEERRAALLFGAGLVVAAILLVGFHRYVRARYPVTPAFSAAMLVGLAGQVVAGLVPIGGDGPAHVVHTASALVLGASLPVFMWRFAASQPAGHRRRVSYALFWAEAAACAVGLSLSARGVAPLAEILPAAVFHAWIAVLTLRGQPDRGRTGLHRSSPTDDPAVARRQGIVTEHYQEGRIGPFAAAAAREQDGDSD